jgi:hypothetical protein
MRRSLVALCSAAVGLAGYSEQVKNEMGAAGDTRTASHDFAPMQVFEVYAVP